MSQEYAFPDLPLTPESREGMILHHQRLAYDMAKRYYWRHDYVQRLGLADATSAAITGLIIAVDRWNGCKESFSTYAAWWMRHEIQTAARHATPVAAPAKMIDGSVPWSYGISLYSWRGEDREERGCEVGDTAEPEDFRHDRDEDIRHAKEVIWPAMARLRELSPKKYRALLRWAHSGRPDFPKLGKLLGMTRSGAGQTVQRGLKELCRIILRRRREMRRNAS